ncbi:MAG: hypothetical protein QOG72_1250 [Sphingomonadales bacterium]|jgi:hypothetical protein|nr:hypothetical protein [Sphingomonadales bacterium]
MTNPADQDRPTAASLRAGSSRLVKAWLQDALAAYFPTRDAGAFAPFEASIGRGYFLADDLRVIYAGVPADNGRAWRGAMADLVAELPASAANVDALDTLIDWARFIAAYEVLARVGNRIRSDSFAGLQLKNGETLLERSLRMAIELAAETTDLRDFFIEAVQSRFFPIHLSLQTLAALCRSEPDHWIAHLGMMRPFIAQMLRHHRPGREGLRRQTQELVDAIGLRRALEGIHKLRRAPSRADDADYDEWLASALLLDEDSIVEMVPDPFFPRPVPGIVFSPRGRRDVRIFVPRSSLDEPASAPPRAGRDRRGERKVDIFLDYKDPAVREIAKQTASAFGW